MVGEFKKIKDLMPRLECNTTTAKEHVSKAEHRIRTIKERTRGLIGTLPFDNIPRRMKIEFIYFVILWLNSFPAKNGISAVYSLENCLCNGTWITPKIVGCCPGLIVKYMMIHYLQTQWSHALMKP